MQNLEQQNKLEDLDANLSNFIQRLAECFTKTENVIQDEAIRTRQLIIQQGNDTRDHVDHTVKVQTDERLAEVQYSRLLDSLRYSGMNDSKNTVEEAYKETFE